MATVKFRLSTTSSTVGPDNLDFTVEKLVTVSEPMSNMSRVSVLTGADTIMLTTANVVTVKNDAGNTLAILRAGEFSLFPVAASAGAEVRADTGTCIVEYGYWAVA